MMILCTPGNPQGAMADLAYLRDAIQLARKHDFLLVVDEPDAVFARAVEAG